jgi:hypothetical protein
MSQLHLLFCTLSIAFHTRTHFLISTYPLPCPVLHYPILSYPAPHCTTPHHTAPHHTTLYYTIPHTIPHEPTPHTSPHHTNPHHTTSHCVSALQGGGQRPLKRRLIVHSRNIRAVIFHPKGKHAHVHAHVHVYVHISTYAQTHVCLSLYLFLCLDICGGFCMILYHHLCIIFYLTSTILLSLFQLLY